MKNDYKMQNIVTGEVVHVPPPPPALEGCARAFNPKKRVWEYIPLTPMED